MRWENEREENEREMRWENERERGDGRMRERERHSFINSFVAAK